MFFMFQGDGGMSKKSIAKKGWIVLAGFLAVILLVPTVALADSCQGDIDKDGTVNESDEIVMDAEMGRDDCFSSPCRADLNRDGKVDSRDGEILKAEFGRDDCDKSKEDVDMLQAEQIENFGVAEEEDAHEDTLPHARFIDNGNGTITDPKTGLMWTKDANLHDDTMLFHQALTYVDEMNEGKHSNFGYTDWRLPALEELRSLIDYTKLKRWIHIIPSGHPFQNVDEIHFNGNNITTCLTSTKHSWFVSSYCRLVGHNVRSCYGYVWPVRSGK